MASGRPFPLPPWPHSSPGNNGNSGDYTEELWQACAGSMVSVPQIGELVWYFPQGHMEQVTASTQQGSCQQLPNSGLDSQILCRVVNRTLSAERDTDEVFAQVSLIPEPQSLNASKELKEDASAPRKRNVRLFTKILTASDTSTHGGFSVLRKHAEDCLPQLDMNQDTPSQDLVARDLHGQEWKFRHTYRGHPRRHLLTTGWSVFVSHKRLLAGDAVIFLRGENGELRVGIRRAKRQQAAQPSVLSGHSMHMGVIATASHAMATRTMFSVYYRPRVSLSPFMVPVDKLAKAIARSLSVGMRFKMRFETEDASERSYAGTVTGMEDLDAASWPNSKWRCLRVNWDEMTSPERQERVSPWEIEPCLSSPMPNPPPAASRSKRFRPPISTSVSELSVHGSGKTGIECTFASKVPRLLQGQESINMGPVWKGSPQCCLEGQQIGGSSASSSLQLPSPRNSFYSPFMSSSDVDYKLPAVPLNNGYAQIHGGRNVIQGSAWSNDCSAPWLMPLMPSRQTSAFSIPGSDKSLVSSNVPSSHIPQHSHMHLSATSTWELFKQEKNIPASSPAFAPAPSPPAPVAAPAPAHATPAVVGESNCKKLFGFPLTDDPIPVGGNAVKALVGVNEDDGGEVISKLDQDVDKDTDMSNPGKSDAISEQERFDSNVSKEAESRSHAVRSCTKVIKKGSMVGRGVDLSKFDSYQKLLEEIETMFHMEGELTNPDKGWHVAYSDNEGDTMLVGDDPWMEFCNMVRKIYILSPEEVHSAGLPEGRSQCNGNDKPIAKDVSKSTDHQSPVLPG